MSVSAAVHKDLNLYITDSRFWTPSFSVAWATVQPSTQGPITDPDDSSNRIGMAYVFDYDSTGWPSGSGYLRATFTSTGVLDLEISETADYDGYLYAGFYAGDFVLSGASLSIFDSNNVESIVLGISDTDPFNTNYTMFSFHITTETLANLEDIYRLRFTFSAPTNTNPTVAFLDPILYISDDLGYIDDSIMNAAGQITDKIDQSTDEITGAVGDAADQIINEDFGYTSPDNVQTDEGLQAGDDLLDSLTASIDDFNASIDEDTDVVVENISGISNFVTGLYGCLPTPIQAVIPGVMAFFVIRKVVGR